MHESRLKFSVHPLGVSIPQTGGLRGQSRMCCNVKGYLINILKLGFFPDQLLLLCSYCILLFVSDLQQKQIAIGESV